MSKIAIISRPDEGVLIDIGGCLTMQEAVEHLTSTLQVSSQFWKGVVVSLNLGQLELTSSQVAQILAIAKGVGAAPQEVFALNEKTRHALKEHNVKLNTGTPVELPHITNENITEQELTIELDGEDFSEVPDTKGLASGEDAVTVAEVTPSLSSKDESYTDIDMVEVKTAKKEVELPLLPAKVLPTVLYLRQTLRAGQAVSHKGHLVIIGDVNPGAEVMAEGDITVWGALRGIAHAGIGGNITAEIRALKLQPIQIRIAHAIARAPDRPRLKYSSKIGPELARIVDGKIRIARSSIE